MRLLFVAPSAYALGGVQNWLDYLLPGLEKSGMEAVLCLVKGRWHRADEYLRAHPWHRHRLVGNPTGSAMGRVNALMDVINEERPDVVVSVNIGDCIEAMRRLKIKQRNAPRLVYTIHAIEGDYFAELIHCQDVVDGVVVTNQLSAKLARHYVPASSEKLYYAPYGVDVGAQSEDISERRTILWMGRFDQPQKRILELPAIVAALGHLDEQWTLRIAGSGPEESALRKNLLSTDSVRVEYLGNVPNEEMLSEVLPRAGLLLVNSSWETGPITIWEAMAAGIAVVSSRYIGSGAEAALRDGENVMLFDVGDADAAAEAITRLGRDDELRNKVINGGRELVNVRYSRTASVDAWRGVLTSVASIRNTERPTAAQPGPPKGRMDRWLGIELAEKVRRVAGISWQHASAGAEWPHVTRGMSAEEAERFFTIATELDRA